MSFGLSADLQAAWRDLSANGLGDARLLYTNARADGWNNSRPKDNC